MTLRELEKAKIKDENLKKSKSRASKEAKVYITEMTEETEKQNADESVKNRFFSDDTSFLSTALFSESKSSEKMRRITIIMILEQSV